MATNGPKDSLNLSVRLPKEGREFVTIVAFFVAILISLWFTGRLLVELNQEREFGGLLVDHFRAFAPLFAGAVTVVVFVTRWLVRLIWRKHEQFVQRGFDALRLDLQKTDEGFSRLEKKVDKAIELSERAVTQSEVNSRHIRDFRAWTRGKAGLPLDEDMESL